MAALVVDNVSKAYRQAGRSVEALRGVSLTIADGEFVAIMGASGSGKSTLLNLMAGLALADSGTVTIRGQNLNVLADYPLTLFRRRNIGLVFQAFNLIPTLTALENVMLPVLFEAKPDEALKDRAAALLAKLDLAGRATHKPDALSGGEQQRVAVARALITSPAVILADEPTGNLDSVASENVCNLLRDLAKNDGKSVVIVTHEPSVASYASRVLVLKDGLLAGEFATAGMNDAAVSLAYHAALKRGISSPAAHG